MIKLNEYIIEKLKINKEVNKAEIPNNKEEFIDLENKASCSFTLEFLLYF